MSQTRPRVLVFGLDQALTARIVDILAEDGYEVIIADSRPAALYLARSVNPAIILVDLAFSVCSCGWSLVTELQASQATKGTPLLAIAHTKTYLDDTKSQFDVYHQAISLGHRGGIAASQPTTSKCQENVSKALYGNLGDLLLLEVGTADDRSTSQHRLAGPDSFHLHHASHQSSSDCTHFGRECHHLPLPDVRTFSDH